LIKIHFSAHGRVRDCKVLGFEASEPCNLIFKVPSNLKS
jgi:hypothetical protein